MRAAFRHVVPVVAGAAVLGLAACTGTGGDLVPDSPGSPAGTTPVATGAASGAAAGSPAPTDGRATARVLDDFADLPASGLDDDGTPVGLQVFGSPDAVVEVDAVTPPEPRPGTGDAAGSALEVTVTTAEHGGVVRVLGDGGSWQPVDATDSTGLGLWFLGTGSGEVWFVDLLDNRSEGSEVDDAGRWTAYFTDDTPGWRRLAWGWDELERKDVGNGAPDDGLTLEAVTGWALGVLDTGGDPVTAYVDDVALLAAGGTDAPAPPRPAPAASPDSTASAAP
ncbi:hypothetical protein [Aquipuribacter nitratireducens]|uniref:Uncharacterized protein n=1 Tax=Aquipuribacter nitratireducens TaxID=650104 RepID=A0ABW0GPQ2_9MICO